MKPISNQSLIVIGAGSFAVSITEMILENGYNIKYFVDKQAKRKSLFGFEVRREISIKDHKDLKIVIAIGTNFIRSSVIEELEIKYKNIKYPKIIDNSSKISKSASVGKGSIVMANTFIGVKSRIRDFCILNTKASIDHESVMQDFSSLGPNVTTGGKVNIGLRSAICIGTTLKDKIKIQRDTVVGAGSYVNKNLNSNSVYYGNPIKFIRKRKFEDDYL